MGRSGDMGMDSAVRHFPCTFKILSLIDLQGRKGFYKNIILKKSPVKIMDKLMPFPPLQPGFKHWVSTEALDCSGRKGKGSPGEKCYKGKLTFCKKNSWECRSFLGKNATQHNGNLYRGYAWD